MGMRAFNVTFSGTTKEVANAEFYAHNFAMAGTPCDRNDFPITEVDEEIYDDLLAMKEWNRGVMEPVFQEG